MFDEPILDALEAIEKMDYPGTLTAYWKYRLLDEDGNLKESVSNQFTLEEIQDDLLYIDAKSKPKWG